MGNPMDDTRGRPLRLPPMHRCLSFCGWVYTALLGVTFVRTGYPLVLLFGLPMGLLLASGVLPLGLAGMLSYVMAYKILPALVWPEDLYAQIMFALWKSLAVALGLTGLAAIFHGACCGRPRSRAGSLANRAVLGVFVAGGASLCYKLWICFVVPEDVLPHSGPWSVVETPALRAAFCGSGVEPGSDTIAAARAAGVLCEPMELRPWEEAEAKASELAAQLSSAERHGLMLGIGWLTLGMGIDVPKLGYYMGNTAPIPRLSLPSIKLADAGNGYRNQPSPHGAVGTSTCFPSALALAATWDEDLVRRTASAMAREFRGKGANVLLGPGLQVHRVARNGRNFEYMAGEDPVLGARLGSAFVEGVQGEGVLACLKHWAFNEQETDRFNQSSDVDEQTAWELYYPPFEAAIRAGAVSVMCGYNRVNGTHACQNEDLLARDLKGKMGFRGFVMSDWYALRDTASDRGVDMEMPGIPKFDSEPWLSHTRLEALEQTLPQERRSDPVRRILAGMLRVRLDERPSCTPGRGCHEAQVSDQRAPEHLALAREAAAAAVVLLKNDGGLLPLPQAPSEGSTLAVIGSPLVAESLSGVHDAMPEQDYYMGGGSGHCSVRQEQLVTPLAALRARAEAAGWRVAASPSNDLAEARVAVEQADLVLALAATTSAEMVDRPDLSLDGGADELVAAVARFGKPTAVLVQAPGAFLTPWRHVATAIAATFMGGEQTGPAWADIVFGDRAPTGRLPLLLPSAVAATIEPSAEPVAAYSEGVFTSYRARDAELHTAFPFGHGLSFTEFQYSGLGRMSSAACPVPALLCLAMDVANAGGYPGSDTVQAYFSYPGRDDAPRRVLRGFRRTATLQPGETERVVFRFDARDLSLHRQGGWQVQAEVVVHITNSSTQVGGLSEKFAIELAPADAAA